MRRLCALASLSTILVLAGCTDETTSAGDDESPDDTVTADIHLESALLPPGELPKGVDLTPVDVDRLDGLAFTIEDGADDTTFKPSECEVYGGVPFDSEGTASAAMYAEKGNPGDFENHSVLQQVVLAGVDGTEISALEDHYRQCGEVRIMHIFRDRPHQSFTVKTSVVEAPDLDADEVVAFESTHSVEDLDRETNLRMIFIVDGDYAIQLSGPPQSEPFNVDELAKVALDRLNDARSREAKQPSPPADQSNILG